MVFSVAGVSNVYQAVVPLIVPPDIVIVCGPMPLAPLLSTPLLMVMELTHWLVWYPKAQMPVV